MTKLKYKRVLLKLSGEALLPEGQKQGLGLEMANHIAAQIKEICDLGTQVGIVVGAGNIFRGGMAARNGMERTTADNIGMLATVINSLGLQDAMLHIGIPTRVVVSEKTLGAGTLEVKNRKTGAVTMRSESELLKFF